MARGLLATTERIASSTCRIPVPVSAREKSAPNAFDAQVLTVEYGGRDSLIRVKTAFGDLWARLPGEFSEGERISLCVPPARTLVYDGEAP